MDKYKQLKLEYAGTRDLIRDYTRSGTISNYLDGLYDALKKDEREEVLYFVGKVVEWYDSNMAKILTNEFVTNKDDYKQNAEILREIYRELKMNDIPEASLSARMNQQIGGKTSSTIFLSHCSASKKYGDALERLIMGIGVQKHQLIYTSHPMHKIPLDKNIYDYLRDNISENVFVLFLLSDEYFESSPCLNEMGAAWVIRSDYSLLYTPEFDLHNPKYLACAIDTDKMGVALDGKENCKAGINELIDKILTLFDLEIDFTSRTYLLDQFMQDIK